MRARVWCLGNKYIPDNPARNLVLSNSLFLINVDKKLKSVILLLRTGVCGVLVCHLDR